MSKKVILSVASFIMLSITNLSYAQSYNPYFTQKQAALHLKQLDCSKDSESCRYYATLEYVAIAQLMRVSIEKQGGKKVTDEEWKPIQDIIDNWHIWKDPKLKHAVLETPNPFLEGIKSNFLVYLNTVTPRESRPEFERIGLMKDQVNPEEHSQILLATKNYKEWLNTKNKTNK